jgi:hypothetical protein
MYRLAGPPLIALAALTATLATIAPDGSGPGVACDELILVYEGKQLVTALRQQGLAFFRPANIDRNFPWKAGGPPVQAPLGYGLLGCAHYVFDRAPDDPSAISITAARFAPAIAFALLILMVGAWAGRREGALAGTFAAAAVALQPRLFGHAHFAALDMLTALFFVAALLAVTEAARTGRLWHFALAGIVWGAAMLVRLHGLLLAPPVVVWLLWRCLRQRQHGRQPVIWSLIAWFAAGVATFVAGWPWLWLAPIARFQQFLASGSARQPLHVFYAGQVWLDRSVPWHYPWVMFAVTVPLGLLVLGMLGIVVTLGKSRKMTEPLETNRISQPADRLRFRNLSTGEDVLLLGTIIFVLTLFSCPGTPVYDGVRLFLMVFPIWAVWTAIGAGWLVSHCRVPLLGTSSALPKLAGRHCLKQAVAHRGEECERNLVRTVAVSLFLALQGLGLVIYCPCHLSYYNLLVGGLAGAERLGFEVTYWGETVREPILAEAARLSHGKPILFAPNLAPFQVPAVEMCSPALHDAGVHLVGWDRSKPAEADDCGYAVIYHRRADLADVEGLLRHGTIVKEYSKQGVWLTQLVRLAPLDGSNQATRIDGLP